ncbi:MAG TPA: response regulator [Stellaceae bacterium]|jgi:CheY-like chemotaxis protein
MARGTGTLRRSGRGVAILVVEDNPTVRATAVEMFRRMGAEVFDTYNGRDALAILEAHPEIALLFADVRMPGMTGTELAEAAKRLRPSLRIVLTSGYLGEAPVPGLPFVPKPWREEAIAELMRQAQPGPGRRTH